MISNCFYLIFFIRRKLRHIHQNIRQLVSLRRQRGQCGALFLRNVFEHFRVMRTGHAGTGTRGRDNIIAVGEFTNHLARERDGRDAVTGVVTGLPAAGLRFGPKILLHFISAFLFRHSAETHAVAY